MCVQCRLWYLGCECLLILLCHSSIPSLHPEQNLKLTNKILEKKKLFSSIHLLLYRLHRISPGYTTCKRGDDFQMVTTVCCDFQASTVNLKAVCWKWQKTLCAAFATKESYTYQAANCIMDKPTLRSGETSLCVRWKVSFMLIHFDVWKVMQLYGVKTKWHC